MYQRTLKNEITIEGVGLHSGLKSVLCLKPAPQNSGIVFEQNKIQIKALYSNVQDTQNCTCLQNKNIKIATIEHLMAALYMAQIDNIIISCSNPELPIMDGSAKCFVEAFKKDNIQEQKAPKKFLKILKKVSFEDDKGNFITLNPSQKNTLHINFEIEFPSKIVGHQIFDNDISVNIFEKEIAPSRTFCEKYQIDYLKSIGLIKGGSLENAVVLDGDQILNPDGFRVQNECVNHKVLDLIGDLYTSGYYILADVKAFKTGHFHNNMVLKKLFENKDNFEIL